MSIKYALATTATEGSFLVAGQDLEPGAEILSEEALVTGPLGTSDLVCLGCHAPLTGDQFHKCSGCWWPLCGEACERRPRHVAECGVLRQDARRIGVPSCRGDTPKYDLILILRGLLLKKTNSAAWDQLMALENHADVWESEGDVYHDAPVRYFSEICKVENDVSDIHKVRGALLTNALVFKNEFGLYVRGVYPKYSLFNHSCIPNVVTIISDNGTVQARAAVPIKNKQKMFTCYTGTTEPLWKRQEHLYKNYKFQCRCARCTDPTELGTYFSMPQCGQCSEGYIIPNDNFETEWKCDKCKHSVSLSDITESVSQSLTHLQSGEIMKPYDAVKISLKLDDVIKQFHSSHYVTLEVTQFVMGKLKSSSYDALKLKKQIWDKQIKIIDKLEPGLTRRRGVVLLESCAAGVALARLAAKQASLAPAVWQQEVSSLQARLDESRQILELEPEGSLRRGWMELSQKLAAELASGGAAVLAQLDCGQI